MPLLELLPSYFGGWRAWATALAVVVLSLLLLRRPRGTAVVLATWPNLLGLYAQAILSASKPKTGKAKPSKAIQVSLARPVHFSPARLRGYLGLAGFADGTAGAVPLLYPVVEGFRLAIQCMVLPAFPFSVLGSVLGRARVLALRRVGAEERLLYSCRVDPAFRATAKGDTELDLVLEAHAAAPSAGGAPPGAGPGGSTLVWRCIFTNIIINPKRPRGGKEPAGPSAAAPAAPASPKVVATWQLGMDTGRRYGLLNGDLNPIHLYPATSALFGFKRPIAHALYLTGRAEASLRSAGLELRYPCVLSAEFKRPTLLPARLHCAWQAVDAPGALDPAADPAAALASPAGAGFAVLTEDLAKPVLVGAVCCHADAVREALAGKA
ncbi:hypothetical protein HYH03_000685 [Edaphochlamys debaryana]|uniref:MaoC-like domain-containing protein n=1 Tax=Edaphochlamys debaryana TaxID=47281 RepID=A0A836C7F3_9CHLO|nr:hypothetical protein HYH03_000685 [Edaphochlamys debaryana]|eukprot:KAG2502198.1 hypothetical protein HYH03_000685 [Edaphochlamys debaryana]